jgi:hypothetical protein
MFEIVDLTFGALKSRGYEPGPIDPSSIPQTPEDVDRLEASLDYNDFDREDVTLRLMTLIATAGSAIYYTEPMKRKWIYELGLSFAVQVKKAHETVAYFLLCHSLGIEDDVPMKRALVILGRKLVQRRPNSYLSGTMLIGLACQVHVSLLLLAQ